MNELLSLRLRLCATFIAATVPVFVSGQVMLSPAAVIGTDLGTFSPEAPLANLINQSGLDTAFLSGTTAFDTYFALPGQTFAANGGPYNWQSDTIFVDPVIGYIDFDLGASHTVKKLAVWNVTAKNITVSFSEEPAGLATAPGAGDFLLTNHSSYTSYPVDILELATPKKGRYVRLAIRSAYPLVPGLNFNYAILGELVASVAPPAGPTITITPAPNGDVIITFTGRLQSTATLAEIFQDVPGMPQGSYTIPKASLSTQQYFRARPD